MELPVWLRDSMPNSPEYLSPKNCECQIQRSHQADLLFWYQRSFSLQWDMGFPQQWIWRDVTLCNLIENYQHFGAIYSLHLQGRTVESTKHLFLQNKQSISLNFWNIHSSTFIWKMDSAFWQCISSHSTSANHHSLRKFRAHQTM